MSPSKLLESQMVITPLKHGVDKKCNYGAEIRGLDLNHLSDEDIQALREAAHKYQLLMIKDQHDLDVVKHWEMIARMDPDAPEVHGHGTVKEFQKTGGMLAVRVPFIVDFGVSISHETETSCSWDPRSSKREIDWQRIPRR